MTDDVNNDDKTPIVMGFLLVAALSAVLFLALIFLSGMIVDYFSGPRIPVARTGDEIISAAFRRIGFGFLIVVAVSTSILLFISKMKRGSGKTFNNITIHLFQFFVLLVGFYCLRATIQISHPVPDEAPETSNIEIIVTPENLQVRDTEGKYFQLGPDQKLSVPIGATYLLRDEAQGNREIEVTEVEQSTLSVDGLFFKNGVGETVILNEGQVIKLSEGTKPFGEGPKIQSEGKGSGGAPPTKKGAPFGLSPTLLLMIILSSMVVVFILELFYFWHRCLEGKPLGDCCTSVSEYLGKNTGVVFDEAGSGYILLGIIGTFWGLLSLLSNAVTTDWPDIDFNNSVAVEDLIRHAIPLLRDASTSLISSAIGVLMAFGSHFLILGVNKDLYIRSAASRTTHDERPAQSAPSRSEEDGSKSESLEEKTEGLEQENEDLKTERDDLKRRHAFILSAKDKEYAAENEIKNSEIKSLKEQLKKKSEKLVSEQSKVSSLTEEISQLELKIDRLKPKPEASNVDAAKVGKTKYGNDLEDAPGEDLDAEASETEPEDGSKRSESSKRKKSSSSKSDEV